jgi:GT2 family glycosyltransferase
MDADPSIGGLTCIVVDKDGNNWFTGGRFKNGLIVNLVDDFRGIRTVDWVAGTACFYRREIFDKIGLFDENFLMYHEDVEFGLRMKAKTNYKACMFAEKLVVHYVVPSIPGGSLYYYLSRNHIILLKRYCPKYIPKVLILRSLREIIALIIVYTLKLRLVYALMGIIAIIRGTRDGLMSREKEATKGSAE